MFYFRSFSTTCEEQTQNDKGNKMKKALITGIFGQDGCYLAKFLLDKGYKVYGTTRKDTEQKRINHRFLGINGKIEIVETTLLDYQEVFEIIKKIKPDEIYNFAAQSSVGLSFERPLYTFEYNVDTVANILESIRNIDCEIRFYQASSGEMFGNLSIDKLPVKIAESFNPASPYAVSKVSAHLLTVNYREVYGIYAVGGILFNHESPLRGENFVTKKIINTAIDISEGKADSITLGNIDVVRDWGYAPEYIKAMWLMLNKEKPSDYLVCSGEPISLKEFLMEVFQYFELDYRKYLNINKDFFRKSDLKVVYGDNTLIKKELGWEYNINFKTLVKKLIEDEMRYREFRNFKFLDFEF